MYKSDRLVILDADGTTIDAFGAIHATFVHHGMNIGPLERFQKRRNLFKYLGGVKEFPVNLRKQIAGTSRARLVETLTEVYLEQRRALEMEERGGAQARVETVEVQEATDIERADGGFTVRGQWTVGGMVTHFGHRHFRQNRYDARVGVVPVEGTWKIRSIEVLEQERLR